MGGGSQASGDTAVALAWGSQALSDYSIALGHSAHVGGSYTYVQDGSTSGIRGTAQNALAIGNTAVANGKDDVVIGTNNTAETPTASYVETNKTGAYAQGGRVIVGHDNSINGRSGNSTAIGSANTINAVHGIALGQNVQVGQKAGATGTKADKTSVMLEYENSMGIGVNAKSLSSNSIALGNGAVAGNERTTDIDTDWNGKGAIAIGETAQATGYYSLGLGAENKSTDDRTVALGHGTQASAQLATALGSEATASGARSTVIGEEASATATRAIAVGAKAKAAGRLAVAIGEEADGSGENGTAVGPEAKAQGKNSVAAGYQAKALSEGEIAIGTSAGNGDNRSNVNNAVSIGTSAHAREAGGVALGNAALANLGKSVAIGDSAKANSADSIAIGSEATASGGAGSIAIGSHSSVGRASGAAGGPRWSTSKDIGGRWYTWTGAKNATQGTYGIWTTTIDPKSTVWQSNLGAVSIGTDGLSGTTYTRQLTGLAAGTQDTDAVNVAQWKNTMLATIGDAKEDSTNTRYGTDNVARNVTRLVNEYLTLTGAADDGTTRTKDELTTDANIGTIVGDNKITFRLAKNLTGLDSVTTGNTKMESTGITITNADSNKSITLDGTNGKATIGGVTVGYVNLGELQTSKGGIVPDGNYVYNLSNITWDPSTYVSGRAATEDQLYSLGSAVTTNINNIEALLGDGSFGLTADDNASTSTNLGSTIKVKGDGQNITTKIDDGTDLQIELNKDLNLGDTGSVKMGNTTINNGGVTITNPTDATKNVSLTDKGLNNGGNKITNIAAGDVSENSTDAVNGSQLHAVEQTITNVDKHHTEVTVAGEAAPAAEGTYTEGNLQIAQTTGKDGQKIYDLKLSDNLNIGGAGKDGAPGKDGHMGINGADGNSGVAIDGKDGISIKGQDGKDGVTIKGIDGKDGVNGAEGHIGLNGKDGFTDIWTTAGTPGLNGKDGETMTRIVYKDPKGDTHEAATLDDGLKFGGDFGTASAVKLNKQVNVKGNATTEADLTDGNIGVVSSQDSDNGKLLVKLNKDLNLGDTGSVKMGNTTINNGGVTITNPTDATKNVSLTDKGLNNGGNKITNIAIGDVSETSTDAVNGSQLYAVEQKINDVEKTAGQHTTVQAGSGNISVTEGTNSAGGKEYTVDLAKDVTFGSDAKQIVINGSDGTLSVGTGDNQVKIDSTDGSIKTGGVTINKDGNGTIDGLTNTTWTEGTFTSGQAATEDQLHTVESNVNKKIDNINTAIENVDKHHTEVTVNGEAAPADGTYTEGNLQIAQTKGADGQKIYDLKLSDNLNIGGAGKDGAPGKDGHMGINGADGKSGVGIDGKDGISIKGKDGQNGVTIKGVDGKDGTEGHIGLTGPKGADGQNATADIHVKNGQNGVYGTDGHGGKDGMDRVVYEDHNGTSHEVATMDDGMKYSGDSGNAAVKLNNNVQVYGGATEYADGANIGVVASQDGDNAKLQVKLAKDLTGINSIEATTINAKTINSDTFQSGNTTINNGGIIITNPTDATKNVSLTDKGLDNGGNKITNIDAGDVSDTSTDAVNGSQLYQRDQVISKIGGEVNKLDRRVDRVGAGAAALAALHPQDFDPDDKWDFAAGYGNYRGANAAAVGAFYRPNEDTTFSIGGTVGGGENMINAGISIKFGQGNHVSNSRVAMAKELLALKDYIKAQDEKIEKLESLIGQSQGNTVKHRSILFPDVPENHWAYVYVKKLADRGYLEGYPDGEFKGDRTMTRYEFAAIFARALDNGLKMDADTEHMSEEFAPEIRELSLNRFRVDRIAGEDNDRHKIERVRVNNRDEIIQDKNGENTKRYRDVYGDVIEKTVDAASR